MIAAKYRECFASDIAKTETFLLSDVGSETVFIFELGIELPHFALFTQLCTQEGKDREALPHYFSNLYYYTYGNRSPTPLKSNIVQDCKIHRERCRQSL